MSINMRTCIKSLNLFFQEDWVSTLFDVRFRPVKNYSFCSCGVYCPLHYETKFQEKKKERIEEEWAIICAIANGQRRRRTLARFQVSFFISLLCLLNALLPWANARSDWPPATVMTWKEKEMERLCYHCSTATWATHFIKMRPFSIKDIKEWPDFPFLPWALPDTWITRCQRTP